MSGLDAVSRAAEQVRALVPSPELRVLRVVGEGGVIAVLLRLRSGVRSTRGTVVLTLDAQDRIVGIRLYVDWSKAVEDGPS